MDQSSEHDEHHTGTRLVIPKTIYGFPWFAWLALAIYAVILFNLVSPYL